MVKKAAAATESPTRVQPKRVLEKPAQPKENASPAGAQKRTKRAFSSYKKLVLAGIRKAGRGKGAGLIAITDYAKGQLSSRVTRVQTKVKKALEEALDAGLITRDYNRRYKIAGASTPKEGAKVAKKKRSTTAAKKKTTTKAAATTKKSASKKRSTAAAKKKKGVTEKRAKATKKSTAAAAKKAKTTTKKEGAKKRKAAPKKKEDVEEGPVGKVNKHNEDNKG